ncbi:hypothetical protein CsSME_00003218 [Camellia sinensis var. sinensis]
MWWVWRGDAIAVTMVGIVEAVMTMGIAGPQGAHRIVVVVITLLLGAHLMEEGQEGSGQGRFHILLMVAQKGTMLVVIVENKHSLKTHFVNVVIFTFCCFMTWKLSSHEIEVST